MTSTKKVPNALAKSNWGKLRNEVWKAPKKKNVVFKKTPSHFVMRQLSRDKTLSQTGLNVKTPDGSFSRLSLLGSRLSNMVGLSIDKDDESGENNTQKKGSKKKWWCVRKLCKLRFRGYRCCSNQDSDWRSHVLTWSFYFTEFFILILPALTATLGALIMYSQRSWLLKVLSIDVSLEYSELILETSTKIDPTAAIESAAALTEQSTAKAALEKLEKMKNFHPAMEINEPLNGLISVLGLIYGLVYAFIFSRSYLRSDEIGRLFHIEISALHEILNYLHLTETFEASLRARVLSNVQKHALDLRMQIMSGSYDAKVNEDSSIYMRTIPDLRLLLSKTVTKERVSFDIRKSTMSQFKTNEAAASGATAATAGGGGDNEANELYCTDQSKFYDTTRGTNNFGNLSTVQENINSARFSFPQIGGTLQDPESIRKQLISQNEMLEEVTFDRILLEGLLESLHRLTETQYVRWDLMDKKIPIPLWSLLIVSVLCLFLPITIVQTGRPLLDQLLCIGIIFCIGFMLYILADVDLIHVGFMKLQCKNLDIMFMLEQEEEHDDILNQEIPEEENECDDESLEHLSTNDLEKKNTDIDLSTSSNTGSSDMIPDSTMGAKAEETTVKKFPWNTVRVSSQRGVLAFIRRLLKFRSNNNNNTTGRRGSKSSPDPRRGSLRMARVTSLVRRNKYKDIGWKLDEHITVKTERKRRRSTSDSVKSSVSVSSSLSSSSGGSKNVSGFALNAGVEKGGSSYVFNNVKTANRTEPRKASDLPV
jgi:hypothetical protein